MSMQGKVRPKDMSERDWSIIRFWDKVDKKGEDDCWEWTASTRTNGYGQIHFDQKMMQAHRASWIIENGKIPEGLVVCHSCDNKTCVNPNHLWIGTQGDNMADRDRKGRQGGGAHLHKPGGIGANQHGIHRI